MSEFRCPVMRDPITGALLVPKPVEHRAHATQFDWRPIETAPKDGRFVLLHVPEGLESGVVTIGAYWKHDERDGLGRFQPGNWDGWLGMDADTMSSICEPTHWIPLPEPPK